MLSTQGMLFSYSTLGSIHAGSVIDNLAEIDTLTSDYQWFATLSC